MTSARILQSSRGYAFASPRSISARRAKGLEPKAEIPIVFPFGKAERTVIAELDEAECLLLAENALAAARELRSAALRVS